MQVPVADSPLSRVDQGFMYVMRKAEKKGSRN